MSCSQCDPTKRGRCYNCGTTYDPGDPLAEAAITGLFTLVVTSIKFVIVHLPALLPAGLITAFITGRIYSLFLDPGWILGIFAVITLIATTQGCWQAFAHAHDKIQERTGALRTILYIIFYGYIVACYAALGYFVADEFEATTQTKIWAVLGTSLVGLGSSWLQMSLAREGKDTIFNETE